MTDIVYKLIASFVFRFWFLSFSGHFFYVLHWDFWTGGWYTKWFLTFNTSSNWSVEYSFVIDMSFGDCCLSSRVVSLGFFFVGTMLNSEILDQFVNLVKCLCVNEIFCGKDFTGSGCKKALNCVHIDWKGREKKETGKNVTPDLDAYYIWMPTCSHIDSDKNWRLD